jgi:predicted nucleic acid-binding protein
VLVDSGAWIALVRTTDEHHPDADRMLRQALRDRVALVTTNLIIAEVHRFILFHVGIRAAALLLDRIDASPLLAIEFVTAAHHAAARRWIAKLSDQVITYTDAVSFAVMEAARCTAVMSFDHDFVTAGFRLWQPRQG